MASLELITIIVEEYDAAIDFFVDVLGFDLVEDSPSTTNDGRPKRWVVVRPQNGETGVLLARADGLGKNRPWEINWPVASGSFCASTTSIRRMTEWSRPA